MTHLKNISFKVALCTLVATFFSPSCIKAQSQKTDGQVLKTMKNATHFMMETASYKGGFVWNYLPDMSRSWGEMEAKRTMVWINQY